MLRHLLQTVTIYPKTFFAKKESISPWSLYEHLGLAASDKFCIWLIPKDIHLHLLRVSCYMAVCIHLGGCEAVCRQWMYS
ncbi:hypothetical protein D3C74_28810 [compost metagenome]